MIKYEEFPLPGYAPRTRHNAKADVTIAFTVDQHTAGEQLTRRAATLERYGHIDLNDAAEEGSYQVDLIARRVIDLIERRCHHQRPKEINIAGNGIYTLQKHGWTQERINQLMIDVFLTVQQKKPDLMPDKFRSGGQTGVDIAAAVMCHALELDAIITFPKGFLQRGSNGVDFTQSLESVRDGVNTMAANCETQGSKTPSP